MEHVDRKVRELFYPEEFDAGIFYPDPKSGPFTLFGHWAIDPEGDRPCLVGLSVWKQAVPEFEQPGVIVGYRPIKGAPVVPDLSGSDLRDISALATVKEALWREIELVLAWRRQQFERMAAEAEDEEAFDFAAAIVAGYERRTPKGRPGRVNPEDVEHFRAVAEVYQRALQGPGRKRPTEAVRQQWDVSHSTATKWVRRARDDFGLLPPAQPGRPSMPTTSGRSRRAK